jgi:hypothetical protein
MLILNDRQRELVNRIDCCRCIENRACDQVKSECPKVNFQTLLVDDISILKPETVMEAAEAGETHVEETCFMQTTKRDFETHLYKNITRCRFKNKILSFFSSEKEAMGLLFFYFSHQGRYYRALRDKSLPDAVLEQQIMSFLYPDSRSFHYAGWHCKFNTADMMFYLYTPSEMEQPAGIRYSEMEVSTPAQAIEFINCY